MIIASSKAAECKVYWENSLVARGRAKAKPGREVYAGRRIVEAIAAGTFENKLLTATAGRALVPVFFADAAIVSLKKEAANGGR